MDKYEGINRAEAQSKTVAYEVRQRNIPSKKQDGQAATKPKPPQNTPQFVWNVLRYGICLVALLTCFAGKFTKYEPAANASNYIKEQLSRDVIKELDLIKDKEAPLEQE